MILFIAILLITSYFKTRNSQLNESHIQNLTYGTVSVYMLWNGVGAHKQIVHISTVFVNEGFTLVRFYQRLVLARDRVYVLFWQWICVYCLYLQIHRDGIL